MAFCIRDPEPEIEESPNKIPPELYDELNNFDPKRDEPYLNEDFLHEESKILQLADQLHEMSNASKTDAEISDGNKLRFWEPDYDNIIAEPYLIEKAMYEIQVPEVQLDKWFKELQKAGEEEERQLARMRRPEPEKKILEAEKVQQESEEIDLEADLPDEAKFTKQHIDRFAFMEQIGITEKQRSENRMLRESVAQEYRIAGNEAYRQDDYNLALNYYTHAIKHVDDSPVLYTSRALCHFKLKNYRQALVDTDHVLHQFDCNSYRAWLYRAASHKRLGMEAQFKNDVFEVKMRNLKRVPYIDDFLYQLKRGQI